MPSVAGQRPGFCSSRWIWRYSSIPGVAEMVPQWGPDQWFMPFCRGSSCRIQSWMELEKRFSAFGAAVALLSLTSLSRAVSSCSVPADGSQSRRKAAALAANCSWNWKTPPWPESG